MECTVSHNTMSSSSLVSNTALFSLFNTQPVALLMNAYRLAPNRLTNVLFFPWLIARQFHSKNPGCTGNSKRMVGFIPINPTFDAQPFRKGINTNSLLFIYTIWVRTIWHSSLSIILPQTTSPTASFHVHHEPYHIRSVTCKGCTILTNSRQCFILF